MNRLILAWVAAASLLLVLPNFFQSGYATTILCQMGIMVVLALSYNLLMGETGMLSFGHAVFFGAGAYAVIHLMRAVNSGMLDLPIAVLPLAGGAMGLVLAFVIGLIVTRRAGIAFAMITLGLGEVAVSVAHMMKGPFGGEEGISADRTIGPTIAGLTFGSPQQLYGLVLVWTLVCVAAMLALTRTPLGRVANAVRDNAERVAYLQFDVRIIRLIMFMAAGLFAGIAGGLAAIVYEIITVEAFSLATSSNVVLMTFIGGTSSFLGPILGAVLVTWLQTISSNYSDAWLFYYGVFFITMVVAAPKGLSGLLRNLKAGWTGPNRLADAKRLSARCVRSVPLVFGFILMTELAYRLSTVSTRGRTLSVFGETFDAASPVAWTIAVALVALGLGLLWFRHREVAALRHSRVEALKAAKEPA